MSWASFRAAAELPDYDEPQEATHAWCSVCDKWRPLAGGVEEEIPDTLSICQQATVLVFTCAECRAAKPAPAEE